MVVAASCCEDAAHQQGPDIFSELNEKWSKIYRNTAKGKCPTVAQSKYCSQSYLEYVELFENFSPQESLNRHEQPGANQPRSMF